MFFAPEMLNVGAHHEILDDPRAPGTRRTQQIIDQIGWLKGLGITETIVPMPPGISGLGEYLDSLSWVADEIMPKLGCTGRMQYCPSRTKSDKRRVGQGGVSRCRTGWTMRL